MAHADRADGAFVLAAVLPLVAWSVHNGVRFDSWGLARGGNAIIPFYRAFITDHIVSPENGEDSRRLATAMQQHLLTREPYRSYGVTLDQLFDDGSFRVHEDLYLLSDQVFGWDTDYGVLRGAGVEGVRAHPGTMPAAWRGRCGTSSEGAVPRRLVGPRARSDARQPATVVDRTGSGCPRRARASRSRQARSSGSLGRTTASGRSGRRRPNGTSSSRIRAIVRVSSRSSARSTSLFDALPDRNGNAQLALRLNQLSRWFPRPWMWILLGLIAIAVRRPRGWPMLVALSLAAFAVVLLNALGLFADLHFVLPVAPGFVLLGLAGLLGARRETD